MVLYTHIYMYMYILYSLETISYKSPYKATMSQYKAAKSLI